MLCFVVTFLNTNCSLSFLLVFVWHYYSNGQIIKFARLYNPEKLNFIPLKLIELQLFKHVRKRVFQMGSSIMWKAIDVFE